MTRRLAILAIAALAASCGDDGDEKDPAEVLPEVPVFAGLESVTPVPGQLDQVDLKWGPATDDRTPPDRLRYELQVRRNRSGYDSLPVTWDVSNRTDGTYRWGLLTPGNVHWFSVVVYDEDGNQAGADRILPAVWPTEPPRITKIEPLRLEAGGRATIVGDYFLDEPAVPDALVVGGRVLTADQFTWTSRQIQFVVPRDLQGEGYIAVTTPMGRVEAPEPLLIDPVGQH
jgi:hypothetical protein